MFSKASRLALEVIQPPPMEMDKMTSSHGIKATGA
jgi:hypothetical protein